MRHLQKILTSESYLALKPTSSWERWVSFMKIVVEIQEIHDLFKKPGNYTAPCAREGSPKATAFFGFFLEREMEAQKIEIIRKRDQLLKRSRQTVPLALIIDCAKQFPPTLSLYILQEFDPKFYSTLQDGHPALIPYMKVRHGSRIRNFRNALPKSLQLFGKFSEPIYVQA
ncbi:hypothetical protein DXG01_012783 [Tephrocybe rancida]|nr:hypothetical protein DXG01_012783 [Tephrocybe rancida]